MTNVGCPDTFIDSFTRACKVRFWTTATVMWRDLYVQTTALLDSTWEDWTSEDDGLLRGLVAPKQHIRATVA